MRSRFNLECRDLPRNLESHVKRVQEQFGDSGVELPEDIRLPKLDPLNISASSFVIMENNNRVVKDINLRNSNFLARRK